MKNPDQKYPKPQPIDSSSSSFDKSSNPNKILSRNTITILLVGVVIFGVGILLFVSWSKLLGANPITYAQCNQLAKEIGTLLKQANYCEVDEDCMVAPAMSGRCWDLVNKNADVASIQEKSFQRQKLDCDKGVVYEQCLRSPQALKCQQNQCVGVWNQDNSVIDTSTWQTYRNDEFGFEVKYPPEWNIYDSDTVSKPETITFIKEPSGEGIDIHPRIVKIIFEPNANKNIPTIEWYKNEWAKQIPAGINFDNLKFEETTFQNLPALRVSNTIFFAKGVYMFRVEWGVIDFGNADPKLVESTEQTFNQILATFRFVP